MLSVGEQALGVGVCVATQAVEEQSARVCRESLLLVGRIGHQEAVLLAQGVVVVGGDLAGFTRVLMLRQA